MKKFLVIGLVAIIGLFAVMAVPGASAAPAEAGQAGSILFEGDDGPKCAGEGK